MLLIPLMKAMLFMYQDSSIAHLLDLRWRLKVVMDVPGGMLRGGITLSLSLELTFQWDCILGAGPVHPVTLDDVQALRFYPLGWGGVDTQIFLKKSELGVLDKSTCRKSVRDVREETNHALVGRTETSESRSRQICDMWKV